MAFTALQYNRAIFEHEVMLEKSLIQVDFICLYSLSNFLADCVELTEKHTAWQSSVLADVLFTARPILSLKKALGELLMGSINMDVDGDSDVDTDPALVNLNDVDMVCKMLHSETLEKNDVIICIVSSLLGILCSETVKNDHVFQCEIAGRAVKLLDPAGKASELPTVFQFSLLLRLPAVMLIEMLPEKDLDWMMVNASFKDLISLCKSLFSSINNKECSSVDLLTQKLCDLVCVVWSLLYRGLSTSTSSADASEIDKILLESDLYTLTEGMLNYFVAIGQESVSEHGEMPLKRSSELLCIESIGAILIRISKKFRKKKQNRCFYSVSHENSTRKTRKRSSTSLKKPTRRNAGSSSESCKETRDEHDAKANVSDSSSSTQDMSDYILKTSDSDDAAKPLKTRHTRPATYTFVRGLFILGFSSQFKCNLDAQIVLRDKYHSYTILLYSKTQGPRSGFKVGG